MLKKCNVDAKFPIYGVLTVPVHGVLKNLELGDGEIFACICKGAVIDQVLSNGTLQRLDLSNYAYDFESDLLKSKEIKKEKKEDDDNDAANKFKEVADKNSEELKKVKEELKLKQELENSDKKIDVADAKVEDVITDKEIITDTEQKVEDITDVKVEDDSTNAVVTDLTPSTESTFIKDNKQESKSFNNKNQNYNKKNR